MSDKEMSEKINEIDENPQTEQTKDAEVPHHIYLIYAYFAFVCMMLSTLCICVHYGLLSLREDSPLTIDELYLTAICALNVSLIMILRFYIRWLTRLPDVIKNILRCVMLVLFLINIAVIIDVGKNPDKSWGDVLTVLGIGIAVIFAYSIFLFRKNPRTGLSIADKLENKSKKITNAQNDQWRERESKTFRGEVNPGYADWFGDKIVIHTKVKAQTATTCVLISIITMMFLIAKIFNDDKDIVSGMVIFAYLIACLLFNIHVYSYIDTAVCKGGISYKDGTKYALTSILVFSMACTIVGHILLIPDWEFDLVRDITGILVAEFPMFIILLLLCAGNNKKNGKMSLFDIDGFQKKLKRDY